jgi:hypothetical protein
MNEHANRMDDGTRVDRDLIRMFLEMTSADRRKYPETVNVFKIDRRAPAPPG